MKTFPQFDAQAWLDRSKKRLRVEVQAATACGPVISADHVIRLLTLEEAEITSAKRLGVAMAQPKLVREHDRVVKACRKAGTHNH